MRRDYMTRLSRIARWKLPPAEAREVIEDYSEMISQNPRSEEELSQDLGKPAEAIRLITQKKLYYRWLVAFAVMSICLLLPAMSRVSFICDFGIFQDFTSMLTYFAGIHLAGNVVIPFFLTAGLIISQIWFRRNGFREKSRLPRRMLPLLAIQFLGLIGVWFIIWLALFCSPEQLAKIFAGEIPRAMVVGDILIWGGFGIAVIGMFGLVKARLEDRRWLAVYALGLTVSALCVAVLALLMNMRLDFNSDGWQMLYFKYYIFLTVIGLGGTVASLC